MKPNFQLYFIFSLLFLGAFPLMLCAQGPGLKVSVGTGVQDVNGGIAVIGDPVGSHIAMDGDDIQAKTSNMANFGRLDVNYYGGDVRMGGAGNFFFLKHGTGLGLGTNNPGGLLHIGFGATGSVIAGTPGGNGPGWIYNAPNGNRWDQFGSNLGVVINRNGTSSSIFLSNSGMFGIKTGLAAPSSDLHVKQTSGNNYNTNGLRLEYGGNTNYWNTLIDIADDYLFAYKGSAKSWISDADGSYNQTSDRSLKQGIRTMPDVLDRVLELRPVTYRYKSHPGADRNSWGFIAQEVEPVFPEFVSEKNNIKGIAYSNFAVVSIKAIQELNSIIETQESKINSLQRELEDLKTQMDQVLTILKDRSDDNKQTISLEKAAYLSQNQPNPFRQNTLITYFVPDHVQGAQIQITNVEGQVLKLIPISQKGAGELNIQANSYPAGTYYYALILDGAIFDTKKMILTAQ